MIKSSLDWYPIESRLLHQSKDLIHFRDIKQMIRNIRSEISELSKAEVNARRGKSTRASELLLKINHDILLVEEYILVAALIG